MGNQYEVIAASGTRTADFTSPDQTNSDSRGIILVVDTMSIASGSLVATIEGKDRISSKYYTILASAPIMAAGVTRLTVYPGLTASTNVAASYVLPQTWRTTVTIASGTAAYTVGASLVV